MAKSKSKVTVSDSVLKRISIEVAKEVEEFIKKTDAFFKYIEPVKGDDVKKLSPKAEKMHKVLLKGDFGCQEQAVRDLLSIITGEKLPKASSDGKDIEFTEHVLVIPTANTNDHDYTFGKVCYPFKYIKHNGTEGNHMDTAVSSFKKPTQKQMEDFILKNFNVIQSSPYGEDD